MQSMNIPVRDVWQEEAAEPEFKPMSADEARVWRERNPTLSPWWVVLTQVLVGAVASLAGGFLTGKPGIAWSVAYGALAIVLPAAVFARGLTGRLASVNPVMAGMGFLLWEMVKLALTLAMLVVAPKLVPGLSWPALLVGLVLALKVYWVALLVAPRKVKLRNE